MKILGLEITRSEKRQASQLNPYYNSFYGYGFGTSSVDIDSVSGIASWNRCSQILAGTISGLPKHLVETTDNDRKIIYDNPSVPLITDMANQNMNSYNWHEYMMQSVINYGNGYSLIRRNAQYQPIGLSIVHPDNVTVYVYDDAVVYEVQYQEKGTIKVLYEDMYHIKGLSHNGYVGINPIQAYKNQLGATISAQKYGKNSYDKGFLSSGYLELEGSLNEETKRNLRENWANVSLGADNMGTPVLDKGQKYVPLKMNHQDAQYLDDRKFQKAEIATMLGVPTHLVNEMGDAKYNNVENTNTQFVQYTIMNYVHKFEEENKKLLREDQRMRYKWRYDVNGLMRGDMAARGEFYAKGIQNSWLKPSEARNMEDLQGGIDDYLLSINNQVPFNEREDFKPNNKGGNE